MTVGASDMDDLLRRTELLVQKIKTTGTANPGFDSVQAGIDEFERLQDHTAAALIPNEEAAAGFQRTRSPRAFVSAFLCKDDRVRDEIRVALTSGPGAVVGTVVSLLTVGLGAGLIVAFSALSAVAVGIAALLLTKGLDGVCAEASGPVESRPA